MTEAISISSLANTSIKKVVKLRQRSHRDETGLMIIEGYREIKRALDNKHLPLELFYCEECFLNRNENTIIERCRNAKASLFKCTVPVFTKISYRDRPEGLLVVAPQVKNSLKDLSVSRNSLIVVAESIEKPGNLGTILRSADAAGVSAVIVCDRCTDINNPNVVRASIGTIFSIPVVETSTAEAQEWLKKRGFHVIAATPHADELYTGVDMTGGTAIILGTEQYGLSDSWLSGKHTKVRIPMLGQCDSLNVASAATILLFEAVRQRGKKSGQSS
jgi:TrmH family RNA methyltransferase